MGRYKLSSVRVCDTCNVVKDLNTTNFRVTNSGASRKSSTCKECESNIVRSTHWDGDKLICNRCRQSLCVESFHNDKTQIYRDGKHPNCKECRSVEVKIRRANQINDRPEYRMLLERFYSSKGRATRLGLDFELTVDILLEKLNNQNKLCAISGLPLTFYLGIGKISTNLSVDRIDSNKGYTVENTHLVCSVVNQMKNDLTEDNLLYYCKTIVDYQNFKNRNR